MRTRSKGQILFLLEIGPRVLISFDSNFLKIHFLVWPPPHLITNLPTFPSLSHPFGLLRILLCSSPMTSFCPSHGGLSGPSPLRASFCPYFLCSKDVFFAQHSEGSWKCVLQLWHFPYAVVWQKLRKITKPKGDPGRVLPSKWQVEGQCCMHIERLSF